MSLPKFASLPNFASPPNLEAVSPSHSCIFCGPRNSECIMNPVKGYQVDISSAQNILDVFTLATETTNDALFTYRGDDGSFIAVDSKTFRNDVQRTATKLQREFGKQHVIAITGENCYHYILCYFAVLASSNIPAVVDKDMDPQIMRESLERINCNNVLYMDDYDKAAQAVLGHSLSFSQACCDTQLDASANAEATCAALPSPLPDDVASIFFTSGSTGVPKAAPLSHRNILQVIKATPDLLPDHDGKIILCLPLHHVFGLVCSVFCPLRYDRISIFINTAIHKLSRDIKEFEPHTLVIVPGIYNMFVQLLKRRKVSVSTREFFGANLQRIVFGGGQLSIIPHDLIEAGVAIYNGYGLTETASAVALHQLAGTPDEMNCLGLPLDGTIITIDDRGEILLEGPSVFSGYLGANAETAKAIDEDGRFHTGDLGYLDERGQLHITGRIKNLIILESGENVPAEPLEQALMELPYVEECIVSGINGRITATIYPSNSAEANEHLAKDLVQINTRFPLTHAITQTALRDDPFPKTGSGKIKRW